MSLFFFWRILILCFLSVPLYSWEVSHEEAESIVKRIFLNECSSNPDKLIWWNDGEHFASLGIGHFIWYPKGAHGSFEEMFPSLISFFKEKGIDMPGWLALNNGCPWTSKEEFMEKKQEAKKKELQALLLRTISWQAVFIAQRFNQALPQLLADLSEEKKNHILKQVEKLGTPQGKYALLDYLNFKGRGSLETERYQGKGWGLRQVLEEMPNQVKKGTGNVDDPVACFAQAAKALLKQRVQNAPPERHEERWLPGWLARIDSYLLKAHGENQ